MDDDDRDPELHRQLYLMLQHVPTKSSSIIHNISEICNKRGSIETAAVRDYHILAAGLIIVIKKLLSKTYQARQSRSGCSYLRDKYCSFSSDADS